MHSRHAIILALMAGAGALIFALASLLTLSLVNKAEPYLSGVEKSEDDESIGDPPRLITETEGSTIQIAEVDKSGNVIRVLISSDINDSIADFSLFAVPQNNYQGVVYVESEQDASGNSLIVYPLEVASGHMSAAIINTPSSQAILSNDQSRVAVVSLNQSPQIIIFDLATGLPLAAWSLASGERLVEADGTWPSENCFEHTVWQASASDNRLFCVPGTSY